MPGYTFFPMVSAIGSSRMLRVEEGEGDAAECRYSS